jgi:hypothetical protein
MTMIDFHRPVHAVRGLGERIEWQPVNVKALYTKS